MAITRHGRNTLKWVQRCRVEVTLYMGTLQLKQNVVCSSRWDIEKGGRGCGLRIGGEGSKVLQLCVLFEHS